MHWRNSNFGIKYFLAAKAHTPDEAYRVLKELYEDRDVAIKNAEASKLRNEAKKLKIEETIRIASQTAETNVSDKIALLEAQAELAELTAFEEQGIAILKAAIKEREYIQSLIDEIQPYRQFKHLPDDEAHQAAQTEEWKRELIWRAENFMASQGFIPHDHLSTMRLHPAWEQELLPQIVKIQEQIRLAHQTGKMFLPMHQPGIPLLTQEKTPKVEETTS